MEKSINLLSKENLLNKSKLEKSGLDINRSDFLFKTLTDVFQEVMMPEASEFGDKSKIHPIVWLLLDTSGKGLKSLFDLCIEIAIVQNIQGYQKVIKRLKDVNAYNGARAEIFVGARLRTITPNITFIKVKEIPQPDFEVKIEDFSFFVEVKYNEKSDFEIGMEMFTGWIQGRLKELFPEDNKLRIVKFGEVWMGSIAAACNIRNNVENASWAFHSSIMSLVFLAYSSINKSIKKDNINDLKLFSDIEIITTNRREESNKSIIIELPHAKNIAPIGSIIRKLTDLKTIQKFNNKNGVLAFYINCPINETMASSLINPILLQCPELSSSLLGIVIYNSENNEPVFIYSISSINKNSPPIWYQNYFKEPIWDEVKCKPIIA